MEMDSNPITKPSKKGAILSAVFLCSCGGAADYSFCLLGSLPPKHFPAA